jgi:hypothetical protein
VATQFEQDQQAVVDAAQREQNLNALHHWLAGNHPEITSPSIAVDRLFEEYADFTERPFTAADFAFMFSNLGSRIHGRQHVPSAGELKAQLIAKICEMISSKDGGRDGKFGKSQLDNERKKMSFWTIPQLTTRLDEIVRRQTLSGKPLEQLKADIAEARRDTRRYPGYPDLPLEIVPKGKVRAVRCDAKYLMNLDSNELRHLCRRYSLPQINDAIRERITE